MRRSAAMLAPETSEKVSLSALRLFARYAVPYRRKIIVAAAALLMVSAATLSLGQGLAFFVDQGLGADNPDMLRLSVFVTLGLASILSIGSYLRARLVNEVGEHIVADMRRALFSHLLHLHTGYFETAKTGDLLSRINTDTILMQTVLTSTLSMAIRNILILIGGLFLLISASMKMSLVIAVIIPLVVVPVVVLGAKLRKASRRAQDKVAEVAVSAEESLSAMRLIHAFHQHAFQDQQFGDKVEASRQAALRRVHLLGLLSATVIFLVFCGIITILWVGGQDLLAGTITAGELSAFVFYAFLVAVSTGALSELAGDLQRAAGAADRVAQILDMKNALPLSDAPITLPRQDDVSVSLEEVSFAYEARPDKPVLDGLSVHIAAGSHVALVGPSGAGKSTLFHLLLRFYDPLSGAIKLNHCDIRDLSLAELRSTIGLVPQEPTLFSGTLADNIAFGSPQASREEIREAARQAEILEFIDALEDGFDSFVGEKGIRLSGGQKQRVAIARVILRNPRLLLLDEATSALDSVSESAVQAALGNVMKDRTSLVIAHRLSTIIDADLILLLDKGQLVATGTHETLLNESALYRELAYYQFGDQQSGS